MLLFDQFEELFTAFPDKWQERTAFIAEIVSAISNDPELHVLMCLREEYLADILTVTESFHEFPGSRYRLSRLTPDEAQQAIEKPVQTVKRSFAPGVARQIVDDLTRMRVETRPGIATDVPGQFVEPVQLQVVGTSLWRSLPREATEITVQHVRLYGDATTALARFYEEAVHETVRRTRVSEPAVRRWFGKRLITPASTRSMAYCGPADTAGLPNDAVAVLENLHMVRAESRAGARWYELTHDRFVGPIQLSNAKARALTPVAMPSLMSGFAILLGIAIFGNRHGRVEALLVVAGAGLVTAGLVLFALMLTADPPWLVLRRRGIVRRVVHVVVHAAFSAAGATCFVFGFLLLNTSAEDLYVSGADSGRFVAYVSDRTGQRIAQDVSVTCKGSVIAVVTSEPRFELGERPIGPEIAWNKFARSWCIRRVSFEFYSSTVLICAGAAVLSVETRGVWRRVGRRASLRRGGPVVPSLTSIWRGALERLGTSRWRRHGGGPSKG